MSTLSTQSTPHPRAKIIPAGRAPCELGWELRDQAQWRINLRGPRSFRFKSDLRNRGCTIAPWLRRSLLFALKSTGSWPSNLNAASTAHGTPGEVTAGVLGALGRL